MELKNEENKMKWNIIADSSCDLFTLEKAYTDISFSTIPFVISVDGKDYIDDETLNTSQMVLIMEESKKASHTACPSPEAWYEQFEKPGYAIAITISSRLSGSYNSASTAMNMILETYPDKKIALIDSQSTGPEMIMIVRKLCKLIESGADFDTVVTGANEYAKRTHIVFALSSFGNLIKNGRMSRIAGFLAGRLHLWGIGIGSEEGTIQIKQRARGKRMAVEAIIDDIRERRNNPGEVVISHCQNPELAQSLKESIEKAWHDAHVTVIPTRGLDSYYAERGGLIVAY